MTPVEPEGVPGGRPTPVAADEMRRLREENAKLASQLADALSGTRFVRDQRRAALNLMEDAVAARQTALDENVVRRRVESELREQTAERELLLDAARAAQARAEEAGRTKDEFLATLSHELRTPLSAIFLWVGALRAGSVPAEETHRALRAIWESAHSQSRLVEDLLDLSRLVAGKLHLAPMEVDLAEATRAAVEVIRLTAEGRRITIDVVLDEPLGAAWLDAARWRQVLWNLLSNATKFTPEGGTITVRLRRRGPQLELEVIDSGEGIAPDFMPFLFERFRQADMGETRHHSGLGIGLALTKQLVELQEGTIEAFSDGLGSGATFRIRLPWSAPPVGAPAPLVGASGVDPGSRALAGLVVLLVEDDANNRVAMQWALEQHGARVAAFGTTREALAHVEAMPSSDLRSLVVVSDLALDGIALLGQLETVARAVGVGTPPALAVTGHARDVDRKRAFEAGFDLYLAKPITPEQLLDAVRDLRDIGASAEYPSREVHT